MHTFNTSPARRAWSVRHAPRRRMAPALRAALAMAAAMGLTATLLLLVLQPTRSADAAPLAQPEPVEPIVAATCTQCDRRGGRWT